MLRGQGNCTLWPLTTKNLKSSKGNILIFLWGDVPLGVPPEFSTGANSAPHPMLFLMNKPVRSLDDGKVFIRYNGILSPSRCSLGGRNQPTASWRCWAPDSSLFRSLNSHSLAWRPDYVMVNRSSAQPHVATHPPGKTRSSSGKKEASSEIQLTC